ncbi:MAG: GtrA family protein [Burkholderiales bacterium]|nr:GtrA family protein [Anaerolineae bacterium]
MTQPDTAKSNRRGVRDTLDIPILAVANRFEGKRSKEVERFLKFMVVGVVGALVDSITLIVVQATIVPPRSHLDVAIASSIAFVAAITSNFIWNRFWTYPDSRSRSVRKQAIQFTLISLFGWIVRTLWITFAYSGLGRALIPAFLLFVRTFHLDYLPTPEARDKLGTMAAWLIGVAVVMVWNYIANRRWTYNDVA